MMIKLNLQNYLIAALVLLFFLLVFKNPFSTNNLIPDLYPIPDSIHYLNPPMSFLKGEGFKITWEEQQINPTVPPLYSLVLLPYLALSNDPRVFYVANVMLAFTSLSLFYILIKRIFKNTWIQLVVLFVFVTNFYIYYYPTLVMAENLLLPLFLGSLLLIVSKITLRSIIFATLLSISFFATRYAAISLSLVFILIFVFKILVEKLSTDRLLIKIGLLLLLIAAGIFFVFNSLNVFDIIALFSMKAFNRNFIQYVAGVIGGPVMFTSIYQPMVNIIIGLVGLPSLIIGIFLKKYRLFSLSLILLLIIPMLFISAFHTVDARYIYQAIPVLTLGFGLFLTGLHWWLNRTGTGNIFYLVLIFIVLFYSFTTFKQMKQYLFESQTPVGYLSVLGFNQYFDRFKGSEKQPILITAHIPYYVDFYSNKTYKLLPLSSVGYFVDQKEKVWGELNFGDLNVLYTDYMKKGYPVYVSNYLTKRGDMIYLQGAIKRVEESFNLKEVSYGCGGLCNIYLLELK